MRMEMVSDLLSITESLFLGAKAPLELAHVKKINKNKNGTENFGIA